MTKSDHRILKPEHQTIISCFSIQAVGIGIYIAFGVFFNPLMETFGWPRAVISGASSTAFFLSGIVAIYVGRLNDRIGPKVIMMVTGILMGAGLIFMAGINSVLQLYLAFGLVFGLGLSSVDVIALSTIARWFPQNRGKITGIVKVGTGAGQFFFPFLASMLISFYGWRNAYLTLGIVCIITLVLIARTLKRDPDSVTESTVSSGNERLTGNKINESGLYFSQAARTVQLWQICFVNLLVVSCLMSTLVHIVPYGRDLDIPAHQAAFVLSTIGAVSMVGRFVTGMVIDRIGSKRAMMVSLFVLIIGFSWLQIADSLWKLFVFAFIYGLAHGGFFTVASPIVAELFGTRSHGNLFGLMVCFGTTGGAGGPFLAGYLFDQGNSYSLPFGIMLVISFLSIILLAFLKPLRTISDLKPDNDV